MQVLCCVLNWNIWDFIHCSLSVVVLALPLLRPGLALANCAAACTTYVHTPCAVMHLEGGEEEVDLAGWLWHSLPTILPGCPIQRMGGAS